MATRQTRNDSGLEQKAKKESHADKTARLKKLLQKLGEQLEKEAEMLKHDGITPVLVFEDGQYRIAYMLGEFVAENEISYDDMETFTKVKRTTRKGLQDDEDTEELDDHRIEKQRMRTSVLMEAGYDQLMANNKTQQKLDSAVDNILKVEKLLGKDSSLMKYVEKRENAGDRPAKEMNFLRGILERKLKVLKKKIQKDSKEEDSARLAKSLGIHHVEEVIGARALSLLKDISRKTLGNSILGKREEHKKLFKDVAAFIERGRKNATAASQATAIEKVLKDLEVFELNPMIDLWSDRDLQRSKLERITDIRRTNKGNHYLEILEAEIQSLALCIFDRALGSDYDAAGLEMKDRENIEKEIDDLFKKKEESGESFLPKDVSDMKQKRKNEAMFKLPITEDQWTNASMIAITFARIKAKDEKKAEDFKKSVIDEIQERRKILSDENRNKILNFVPTTEPRDYQRRGTNNFFLKEEKKEKKKRGRKELAPGFSCKESMEIFNKIKMTSKDISKDGAPPEIKRELAMAPMRIGCQELRNKALLFVLSTFATYVAEQDEELDEW